MSLSTNALLRYPASSRLRPGFSKRMAYALTLSAALHGIVWEFRHLIDPATPAISKPPAIIEVVMVSKPKLLESAPTPPVAPPPPVQAPAPPKPPKTKTPPAPKPKPQPVVQPRKLVPTPKPSEITTPKPTPVAAEPSPAAPAAPVSAPAPPTPHREAREETYTEAKADAAYLNNPRPDYPMQAKRRFLEGKVILKVQVLASGQPGQIVVESGSGHDILDTAAMETVQKWRFVPAKRGDKAVDSWVKVPIVFKLNK